MDLNKLDINEILSTIDNISSDAVLNTSVKDQQNINRDALKTIGISNTKIDGLLSSLYGYKLVETMDELEYGLFTRVVKLNNVETMDDIKVKTVGIAVNCYDVFSQKHQRNRVMIKCKLGRTFNNVVFEECFLFQKIRTDDLLVMSMIDYLRE